jgi:hypothetical protein
MCQLSARSFNCLVEKGLTNREEICSLLDSGKFPYTRNLGRKSMTEIAKWCEAKTEPKTLINKYLEAYRVKHTGILQPMNPKFSKGTIVKYKTGWMQVRAVFKNTVNLGPIFGGKTTVKKVSQSEVYPDFDAWSSAWSKSESYQSM